MKCYTGAGDRGDTCILGGRVDKHDDRIDAIGHVDELNAVLGSAASFSSHEHVKRIISTVQNDLFTIGAELATTIVPARDKVGISADLIVMMERLIDMLNKDLPQQTKFIIPSGTQAATMLNLARTVARRTERALVKLDRTEKINPEILRYANRLSSLLHTLYRLENSSNKIVEDNPRYHYIKSDDFQSSLNTWSSLVQ